MERISFIKEVSEKPKEFETWARLDINTALNKWQRHLEQFPMADFGTFPATIEELRAANHNFDSTFDRLRQVESALVKFGETAQGKSNSGKNIGHEMHFVLIPWGMFSRQLQRKQYGDLPDLFYELAETRKNQDRTAAESYNDLDGKIMRYLHADAVHYISDAQGMSREFTALEYVKRRADQDGDWGIMLMQTSSKSGLGAKDDSPTNVTLQSARGLTLAGARVDKLGVFETLAATLQEESLVFEDKFWLPANIFGRIASDDTSLSKSLQEFDSQASSLFSSIERRQVRLAIN